MSGFLTVVSGFSGVGKGTVVRKLLDLYPETYCLSVSATTRERRDKEIDGVHYHFTDEAGFDELIRNHELLEYTTYNGHRYGTPQKAVEEALKSDKTVILEIEVIGGLNVKKLFPEALLIFLAPPSPEDVYERLKGRGTDSEEQIINRMKRAAEETAYMPAYDYIVTNDYVERCTDEIHQLITKEREACENVRAQAADLRERFLKLTGEE